MPLPSRRPLSSTQAFALERLEQTLGLDDNEEELELVRSRFEEFAAREAPYPEALTAVTVNPNERTTSSAIAALAEQFVSATRRILAGQPHGRAEAFRHLVRASFVAGSSLGVRQQFFRQAMAQNIGLSTVAGMALVSRLLIDHGWSSLAWDGALVGSLAGLSAVLAVNQRREARANPEGPVFLLPLVRGQGTRQMARLHMRQFWSDVREGLVAGDATPGALKAKLTDAGEPDDVARTILSALEVSGRGCTVWLED